MDKIHLTHTIFIIDYHLLGFFMSRIPKGDILGLRLLNLCILVIFAYDCDIAYFSQSSHIKTNMVSITCQRFNEKIIP